ncbi:hypothetical protein [Jannaschia marina]|uniref:hypothetical protein n=1 Tax=Jannaschia marina TaxID=2741674 RepID=UPI0015CEAF5C|nr:hypothetical protein [Jannaschia marina]
MRRAAFTFGYLLLALVALGAAVMLQMTGAFALVNAACVDGVETGTVLATQARVFIVLAVFSFGPLFVVHRVVPALFWPALAPAALAVAGCVAETIRIATAPMLSEPVCTGAAAAGFAQLSGLGALLMLAALAAHVIVAIRGVRALARAAG